MSHTHLGDIRSRTIIDVLLDSPVKCQAISVLAC